ncbi:hypothetical protein AERO9A_360047 [Aeromonas salmonicida]|nr:hypothetical protein AERO9A_360047 [Aeromonas salmonicida]
MFMTDWLFMTACPACDCAHQRLPAPGTGTTPVDAGALTTAAKLGLRRNFSTAIRGGDYAKSPWPAQAAS